MTAVVLLLLTVAASAPPLPVVVLAPGPSEGCGLPALVDEGSPPRRLTGGPTAFCVRRAFAARLEDSGITHVVLQVRGPETSDRVFIYRLAGEALVPRYLASGPSHLRLDRVERISGDVRDRLLLHSVDESGSTIVLSCAFDGFPLVCVPAPAAATAPRP